MSTCCLFFYRILAIISGLCCAPLASKGADAVKGFRSQSHGYAVEYPSRWYPHILSDVFYIENFPPSKAVRAERLPDGGAAIEILVPSQVVPKGKTLPASLDEWARVAVGRRTVLGKVTRELATGPQKLSVLEVDTRCCAVSPYQESVEWFFEIHGKMFAGIVVYWQGDSNAGRFREILQRIVLSLKVIPTAPN